MLDIMLWGRNVSSAKHALNGPVKRLFGVLHGKLTNVITNINKSMSYVAEPEMKLFQKKNLWYKCGSNLSNPPITRH